MLFASAIFPYATCTAAVVPAQGINAAGWAQDRPGFGGYGITHITNGSGCAAATARGKQ